MGSYHVKEGSCPPLTSHAPPGGGADASFGPPMLGLVLTWCCGSGGVLPGGWCTAGVAGFLDGTGPPEGVQRLFWSKAESTTFVSAAAHFKELDDNKSDLDDNLISGSPGVMVREIEDQTTGRGRTFAGSCILAAFRTRLPPPMPPGIARTP